MNNKQISILLFIKGILAILIGVNLKLNGNQLYYYAIIVGLVFQLLSFLLFYNYKREILK